MSFSFFAAPRDVMLILFLFFTDLLISRSVKISHFVYDEEHVDALGDES